MNYLRYTKLCILLKLITMSIHYEEHSSSQTGVCFCTGPIHKSTLILDGHYFALLWKYRKWPFSLPYKRFL